MPTASEHPLSTSESATDLVMGVIQRVYGDATQTALDHTAASQIVAALRRAGWSSLDEMAMLIDAAGGEIVVPGRILGDIRERRVTVQDDFATMGKKFRVSVAP